MPGFVGYRSFILLMVQGSCVYRPWVARLDWLDLTGPRWKSFGD